MKIPYPYSLIEHQYRIANHVIFDFELKAYNYLVIVA
jgi:hypothetical protein